jgi:hypothetical protein
MGASDDASTRILHRGCSFGVVLSGTRGEPGLQFLPNVSRRGLYALTIPMGIEGIVQQSPGLRLLGRVPLACGECQEAENALTACIFPHLSMLHRGPKCQLGPHWLFRLIVWGLYLVLCCDPAQSRHAVGARRRHARSSAPRPRQQSILPERQWANARRDRSG